MGYDLSNRGPQANQFGGFFNNLAKGVSLRNEEARKRQALEAERARKEELWMKLQNPQQTALNRLKTRGTMSDSEYQQYQDAQPGLLSNIGDFFTGETTQPQYSPELAAKVAQRDEFNKYGVVTPELEKYVGEDAQQAEQVRALGGLGEEDAALQLLGLGGNKGLTAGQQMGLQARKAQAALEPELNTLARTLSNTQPGTPEHTALAEQYDQKVSAYNKLAFTASDRWKGPSVTGVEEDIAKGKRSAKKASQETLKPYIDAYKRNTKPLFDKIAALSKISDMISQAKAGNGVARKGLLAATSRLSSNEALSDGEMAIMMSGNLSDIWKQFGEKRFGSGASIGETEVKNAIDIYNQVLGTVKSEKGSVTNEFKKTLGDELGSATSRGYSKNVLDKLLFGGVKLPSGVSSKGIQKGEIKDENQGTVGKIVTGALEKAGEIIAPKKTQPKEMSRLDKLKALRNKK